MMIKLEMVEYNPYRDLALDPINKNTVDKMKASITDLGFWGGLAVRKVGDKYQLAFGHHRLEALLELGWEKADLNVVKYDDDQMVRAMVVENATQRGAEGGATIDSVAGIVRRIGYLLLTQSKEELELSKIFESSRNGVETAKTLFLAGNGVGEPVICNYEPSLSANSVRQALVVLKESNHLHTLMLAIKDVIAIEQVQAQEKADEAKTQKAKDAAQVDADKLQESEEKAAEAAEAAVREQHYNPLVESIFNRESHAKAFRDVVTSDNGKEFIPVDRQLDIAVAIIADAKKEKKSLSAKFIRDKVMCVLSEALGFRKAQREKLLQENANLKAQDSWKKIMSSINSLTKRTEELQVLLDDGAVLTDDSKVPTTFNLFVPKLKEALDTLQEIVHIETDIVSDQ